jgi:hypothetical protein
MLAEAKAHNAAPARLALYSTSADAQPDPEAWQEELGIPVRPAGIWDSLAAPITAGISLANEQRRWQNLASALPRLRPAAWIVGAALAIQAHAGADWTLLASEQRTCARDGDAIRNVFPMLWWQSIGAANAPQAPEARRANQPDGDFRR